MSRKFALFLMVGGTAAAVNVAVRWLADLVTTYDVAIVMAFFVALTTAFLLNRRLVFEADGPSAGQFWRFLLVNLLALVQVWGVSVLLARIVFPAAGFDWHAKTIAHTIGVISPVVTSYFAHKHFSFAKRG